MEKENLGRERTIASAYHATDWTNVALCELSVCFMSCLLLIVVGIGDSTKEDGSESANAGSRGTASLNEDIEAVKRRVEKYAQRKQLGAGTAVEESRQSVVNCYKDHPDKPLNCWREVEEFKKQVASVEGVCILLTKRYLTNTFLSAL